MITGPQSIGHRLSRAGKAMALAVSLVCSALLVTLALGEPECRWLAWISFLPLFVAVRSLRPVGAALSGALWGACLYLFSSAGPWPIAGDGSSLAMGPSLRLLTLLVLIPAVYAGLAALPARAIGFKLFTLALGWTLLEIVLQRHNLSRRQDGLLVQVQDQGLYLYSLKRLLAYVLTAFLVACVNASLIGILCGVRLHLPTEYSRAGSLDVAGWLWTQRVLAIDAWTLRQAYPRGPPITSQPAPGLGRV